jgi:hypothetical protein
MRKRVFGGAMGDGRRNRNHREAAGESGEPFDSPCLYIGILFGVTNDPGKLAERDIRNSKFGRCHRRHASRCLGARPRVADRPPEGRMGIEHELHAFHSLAA